MQKLFPAFGTVNSLSLPEGHDAAALEEIKKRMMQLHKSVSFFDPESEISRINRQAGDRPVAVSEDTFALLSRAVTYARATNGAFDVTAGPLTALWKNALRRAALPVEEEIARCRKLCTIDGLVLDQGHGTAFLREKGMQLDLGGIAKGYAAEQARIMLQAAGVRNAQINFGGTVITLGKAQTVGIRNPFRETGCPMAYVKLQNQAIVTSGTYEQCFVHQGRRYHHIIDPRTGRPSCSGLLSVSLIGEDAAMLDALATGICCLGRAAGADIARRYGISAVFVTEQGNVQITPDLQGKISFMQQNDF